MLVGVFETVRDLSFPATPSAQPRLRSPAPPCCWLLRNVAPRCSRSHGAVDGSWSPFRLLLRVSHLFCILLNTPKLCRRSPGPARWSPSRPALLVLLRLLVLRLCPRSSWTGSPGTREPRCRSSLPFRRLRGSGKAGGTDCRRSLQSPTLNR